MSFGADWKGNKQSEEDSDCAVCPIFFIKKRGGQININSGSAAQNQNNVFLHEVVDPERFGLIFCNTEVVSNGSSKFYRKTFSHLRQIERSSFYVIL